MKSVLAAAACAVLLSGCGGDDSSGGGTTVPSASTTPPETASVSGAIETPSTVAVPDTPLCNAAAEVLAVGSTVEPKVATAVQQALAAQSVQPAVDAVKALEDDGSVERLLAAYDEMTDVVPADQASNVRTVRAYTKSFLDDVAAMPNAGELQAYVAQANASAEGQAAVAATAALDEVVTAQCHFSLSG